MAAFKESLVWRALYAVVVVIVLALFLLSLEAVLSPFLLFLLLVFLLAPISGTRVHLLIVSATTVLTLVWLLETTGFLLAPFLLALVLAYVMQPLVRRLEGVTVASGWRISRMVAILLLSLPMLAVITVGVFWGLPALSEQIARFIRAVPGYFAEGVALVERTRREVVRQDLPFVDEEALLAQLRAVRPEDVVAYLQARQQALARQVWQAVLGAGRGLSALLTVLSYVFLTPILTFYLLRDYDRITGRLAALVPRPQAKRVLGFAAEYDRLLARYLRGQLIAAALIGLATGLGFTLVDFPYALLLGVVAGVFNVVPYLGLIVSLVPAVVIALFSGAVLISFAKIAGVVVVVQILDSAVIGPKVVGESVGLHPVWVMLALAVAGYFWGFVGLLIAIPLAVLVKLLLAAALDRYRRSSLFLGGELARPARGGSPT